MDSGFSADDVSSDDPDIESLPRAAPAPKKPAAKKAARPAVVTSHSLPAVVPRIPSVGKRSSKKTG